MGRTKSNARTKAVKTDKPTPKPQQRPHVPQSTPREMSNPRTTPARVTVRGEKGKTSSAPHPVPMTEELRQKSKSESNAAVKPLVEADEKAVKAAMVAKFIATPRNLLTSALCHAQTAPTLQAWCRQHEVKGYSALKKDELVALIVNGKAPAPTAGSARAVREEAKTLKAAGKLTGPVSSASKAALEAAIASAKGGAVVTVSKPIPKADSCDDMRSRLRGKDGKYDACVNKWAKEKFGKTVSGLNRDDLVACCKKFGR